MIKIAIGSTLSALGLMCRIALADPAPPVEAVYLPKIVPQCVKFQVPGVGTVCGYRDVEDWKDVLEVDAELVLLRDQVDASTRQAEAEHAAVLALTDAVALREAALKATQRNLALERMNLKERDRLYQNAVNRPRWGTWLSWGLAIGASTAAISLGVVVFAH